MSTACGDSREAILYFEPKECRGEVASFDKSVFFWTHQGFGFGYVGGGDPEPNLTNLDKCIPEVSEHFETDGQRKVFWDNSYTRR